MNEPVPGLYAMRGLPVLRCERCTLPHDAVTGCRDAAHAFLCAVPDELRAAIMKAVWDFERIARQLAELDTRANPDNARAVLA